MNYSGQLIETLKEKMSFSKDAEVVQVLPNITKGSLSEIKSGKRHLTEEQALWIAQQCALDAAHVLVELAAERSKSSTAQAVWSELAKKLKAAASAAVVVAILVFSAVSAANHPLRLKRITHNVYYVKSHYAGVTASLWLGGAAKLV